MTNLIIACLLISTSMPVTAASFKLDANGNDPFYQTTISKEVYQYTHSSTLQDLTIQNASGEQVPYALIPYEDLHPQTTTHQDSKPLIIYPIKESALDNPNELRIHLQKNTGNTLIDIVSSNDKADVSKNTNSIYLLDAGKKHAPLETISVDWQGVDGKLLTLEVLTSDDLQHWSHAGNAVLLKTSNANSSILQNNISLNSPSEARYLQIRTTEPNNANFKLTKANAEYSKMQSITPKLVLQTIQLIERSEDTKNGLVNIDFESAGHFPASYLQIKLPQNNTITNATIQVRNNTNEPWEYLTTASVYRLMQQGKTFTSPDVVLSPTVARYWRLQFNQASGGIGVESPTLSLGWLPSTVVWNARGQAPFTLHVGEKPSIVNNVPITNLILDYKIEKIQALANSGLTMEVSANNSTVEQAANTWTAPIDYKRWLLWGGLFLGVLLLAGMAFSLIKTDTKE
ncbi:MAG: DUF3999 domain-containing protein [Methylotenera sp.]|uniref:DUF3999 domain-containing protein n=1 Tax=Methylotenera sp. TaxID=2051956 RepID=UPI002487E5BB|nr:DUF3999 domain-containing protein [Methylotenera sp.]MDI1308791.1 DUF3999 domain-containing protein [Methylotenera sp.]